jgi:hypothetical protein
MLYVGRVVARRLGHVIARRLGRGHVIARRLDRAIARRLGRVIARRLGRVVAHSLLQKKKTHICHICGVSRRINAAILIDSSSSCPYEAIQ